MILIGLGVLFLLDNLGILPLEEITKYWPLLLIAVGLFLLVDRTVWRVRMAPWPPWFGVGGFKGFRMRESAIFGGGKRKITAQDFSGGKIDAVFAGYEVDLREAIMKDDAAILDVNVVFGGVELRIPDTWSAVVQGDGVFGAFSDNSRQPDPMRVPNPKRLVVKGAAVFGHVEVKN